MALHESMKSQVVGRQRHDFRYSVDSRKIESLGFKGTVELDKGLELIIAWYLVIAS
jgi:dTDP-D-glucose 4,6-dehydratase